MPQNSPSGVYIKGGEEPDERVTHLLDNRPLSEDNPDAKSRVRYSRERLLLRTAVTMIPEIPWKKAQ